MEFIIFKINSKGGLYFEKINIKWNYINSIVNNLIRINKAKEIVDLLEIPISIEEEIKKEIIIKRVHYSTKLKEIV